jgi:predicted metal-dependent hydrolase
MTAAHLRERPSRQLDINGSAVTVKVRESDRARTTRILLGARRPLEIIVPVGTADDEIDGLLATRRGWIADKLDAVAVEQARPARLGLGRRGVVWLAGQPIPVEQREAERAVARLDDQVLVALGTTPAARAEAVERWYRREARSGLRAVTAAEAQRLGLPYRSVTIRDQLTRWGSCSSAGNLSFNWRLAVAPADVMTYVVIHELCHLAVPNHTKAFWRQLDAALPDWQEPAAWLREHGAGLRAYSVAL